MAKTLRQLKIHEVSLVDRGANAHAKVLLAKRDVKKGIPLDCPECGFDLPTFYGAAGTELPNFCPECGAAMSLSAVSKADPAVKAKATKKKEHDMKELTPEALAKLDPAVRAAVEKVQADLQAANEKLAAVEKGADDKDAIFKGLTPAARELVEKTQRDNAAATERIAKLEDAALTTEFVAKAAALPNLAKSAKDLAGIMKSAFRKLEKADFEALEALLKSANEAIGKGGLFAELGTGGGSSAGNGDSAYAEAKAIAEELVKKGEAKTREQALELVFKRQPELYARHATESRRN
jgi:predicted RNA-binding Zn-ribbon protein involved in translation (DUF1610 family)